MNVAALEKAKETILADPEFCLNTYDHCIAHHICKNDPDTTFAHLSVASVNGVRIHVFDRACQILGVDPHVVTLFYGHGSSPFDEPDQRTSAIKRIDFLLRRCTNFIIEYAGYHLEVPIDWRPVVAEQPAPAEQEVEEQELACV